MKKTIYNPETLGPPVGHFDRAVRFDDWLFISGTSALTHLRGDMATAISSRGSKPRRTRPWTISKRFVGRLGVRLQTFTKSA